MKIALLVRPVSLAGHLTEVDDGVLDFAKHIHANEQENSDIARNGVKATDSQDPQLYPLKPTLWSDSNPFPSACQALADLRQLKTFAQAGPPAAEPTGSVLPSFPVAVSTFVGNVSTNPDASPRDQLMAACRVPSTRR